MKSKIIEQAFDQATSNPNEIIIPDQILDLIGETEDNEFNLDDLENM